MILATINLYFPQRGKWAGYWRRIPFNADASAMARRGHITRSIEP